MEKNTCPDNLCDGTGWIGEDERCICNLEERIEDAMDDDSDNLSNDLN